MKIRAFEERAVMQKVVLSCDLEISPKQPGTWPTWNFKEAGKNCNGFYLH